MSRITIKIDVDFTEGELKSLTGDLWSKAEQKILNVLRKYDAGNGVSKKEISLNAGRAVPGAGNREALLAQLIQEGIVEILPPPPGRRSARYAIRKNKRRA